MSLSHRGSRRAAPEHRAPWRRAHLPVALRALRHRNYRLLAAGQLISVVGTWMQMIGQNWLVLRLTGSGTALGTTVALQALPVMALSLWGGAIADRFPKRRVLVVTQSLMAVIALTLGLVVVTGVVQLWMVYALAVAVGTVNALDGPASGAFGAELVPIEDLSNAVALGGAANSLGRVVGMSLAGVLIAVAGEPVVFFANAASYLAVLVALAGLRPEEMRPLARATGTSRIRDGVRAVRSSTSVPAVLVLAFVVAAFGRNYQVTMAMMSRDVFHAGAGGYGMLSTVFAVGATLGALVTARMRRLTLTLLLMTVGAASFAQVMSGVAPGLGVFAAMILPISLGAVVIDSATNVLVQERTPDDVRARALALLGAVSMAGAALGGPALGWLGQHLGARAPLVIGGVVVLMVAVAAALRERPLRVMLASVRRLDRWRVDRWRVDRWRAEEGEPEELAVARAA